MTEERDSSPTDALFAEFLFQQEREGGLDFEAFCAVHQDQAEALRVHLDDWGRVRSILDRLGVAGALASRIRARYGQGKDHPVTLKSEEEESDDFTSEVLKRLSSRYGSYGRYKLKGEVGRGGMGAVLRVWDEDLRRHLAMKVILKKEEKTSGDSPDVDSSALARFLEEAQVTGQLDHPGIVPVHELGLDHEGRVYFTMRLVRGRDLKHIFDQVQRHDEGWTQTRALGVLLKVCEAMTYAHDKGVIHRDLKPGNVMVGKYGEVYVMDWGLARVEGLEDGRNLRIEATTSSTLSEVRTDRRESRETSVDSPIFTMDGTVVGTPAYMPPEQARGEIEQIGRHSDVYSIGAMLYQLLSGCVPFVPPGALVSPRTILMRVIEGPPRPVRDLAPHPVPAELEAICERAMARDPKARYPDMGALAADLREYLEGRVKQATVRNMRILLSRVQKSVSIVAKLPLIVSDDDELIEKALERGVKIRILVETPEDFDVHDEPTIQRQLALGCESRRMALVPMRFGVFDEKITILPMYDDAGGGEGLKMLEVRNGSLAEGLTRIFDGYWEAAARLGL